MKHRLLPVKAAALSLSLSLAGCGSMSGFTESSSSFGCKAPKGVSCKSVSGVYANSRGTRDASEEALPQATAITSYVSDPLPVALPGMPIRSQAQMLRVWTSPWEDEEGDLHDQSFLYLVPNQGRWLVDQTREATAQRTLHRLRAANIPKGDEATQSAEGRAHRSAEGVAESSLQAGGIRQ